MKLDRLETHDRLQHFQNQWQAISQGCQDCINNVPESITFPFYVFAHPRTVEADEKIDLILRANFTQKSIPTTRMIWTPRITKPKAQTNSYLFLARKNTDLIQVIWLLPPREMWSQYEPGKMTHNADVWTSINNFQFHRKKLEEKEPNGPTSQNEDEFRKIYAYEAQKRIKQHSLEESSTS